MTGCFFCFDAGRNENSFIKSNVQINEPSFLSDKESILENEFNVWLHKLYVGTNIEYEHIDLKNAFKFLGKGYSSLGLISQLPFDIIKVDKSFSEKNHGTEGIIYAILIIET